MAGVRKKPTKGGLYQAYYTDWTGKRRYLTADTTKKALQAAYAIEKEHDEIRKGYRPALNCVQQHKKKSYGDVVAEYLAWGMAQGGRKGRPWSEHHGIQRKRQLTWWQDQIGLIGLGDLDGVLPRAEKALRGLLKLGRAGKTVANYAEGLSAFCDWCIQRGYMDVDPLKGLAPFDTTPQSVRRAMTPEEINRLLDHAPPHRRILYETAFLSGLRANELRSLTVDDLDTVRCGLHLASEWTKNRKSGFQPLPRNLVERLKDFAASGEACRIYKQSFKQARSKLEPPQNRLFYVASQTDRVLSVDLEAAGIPKHTPKGKLDFHACRVAFINLILEQGEVSPKEAQELARHSTVDLTMNIYGRVREERLSEAVERVGHVILKEKCVPSVYRFAVGAEPETATPVESESCGFINMVGGAGFEPTKAEPTDLQSAPFDRFGIPPALLN